MSDPARWHEQVAGAFGARVGGTVDWDAPSPVAGWRARDVVGHLTEWFPAFLAAGAGIDLPRADPDPVEAWAAQAAAVQALLDDPASAQRVLRNPHLGEVPLPAAIDRFYTADVFMHTWDLARATGQDDRLDPDFCELPHHAAAEAEPHRRERDARVPAGELGQPALQVGGEVGVVDLPQRARGVRRSRGATGAGEQVRGQRGVAVTREPSGDGADVAGWWRVLAGSRRCRPPATPSPPPRTGPAA